MSKPLTRTPHNVGTLYLLPEAQNESRRRFLQRAVRVSPPLISAAAEAVQRTISGQQLRAILIQLAEPMIRPRRTRQQLRSNADTISASRPRTYGLGTEAIETAQRESLMS